MNNPYFIADIGMSHKGVELLAEELIKDLVEMGCDAVKFQSWIPESLYARWAMPDDIDKLPLSDKDYKDLKKYCKGKIDFSSSVFSIAEIEAFGALKVPWFKVASMDLNNVLFLEYIAQRGKPIILSTGMGTLAEIENALNVITKAGNDQITLLHCVSLYPPDDSMVNLRNIPMLKEAFGFPVGFSDHTEGNEAAFAAIALGATVIEKHFPCEDMEGLIDGGRRIKNQLGTPNRKLTPEELDKRGEFRRSIVAARTIEQGTYLKMEDLAFKRPGCGIPPTEYPYLLGRRTKFNLKKDARIMWSDV